LAEFTLVFELGVSFVRIRDKSGMGGNERVGINSNFSNMFVACVKALESTIKLCIVGNVNEAMYRER
jgi:hypothetical protein